MSVGRRIEYKHPEFIPFTLRNPDLLNSMKIVFLIIIIIAYGDLHHACISDFRQCIVVTETGTLWKGNCHFIILSSYF